MQSKWTQDILLISLGKMSSSNDSYVLKKSLRVNCRIMFVRFYNKKLNNSTLVLVTSERARVSETQFMTNKRFVPVRVYFYHYINLSLLHDP